MRRVELEDITISQEFSFFDTLRKIDANGKGICFVTNQDGVLVGLLTDGDVRRALLSGVDLKSSISEYVNKDFKSLHYKSSEKEIQRNLKAPVKHIPLVDDEFKLVDYASSYDKFRIPVLEPNLKGNELNYITRCIKTNWISSKGKFVSQFEEQFQNYCDMPHALATSNGTVALHLAMRVFEIGKGDEVIVPNLTFASTVNAVLFEDATPVLADIDPETLTIDINSIKQLINENTRAIMPVHLYGHPCDMDPIMEIAREHDLIVIEDCAEALGSTYKGRSVGSFGDASMFSFFGNKTITTGEGGMLLFKDEKVFRKAEVLRDHGMSKERRYWHEFVGYNYRMTNLQAAIGVAQMERIDKFIQRKREIAERYSKAFASLPVSTPAEMNWAVNSYWLYTVILDHSYDMESLVDDLLKSGVECRPIFYPIGDMPPYDSFDHDDLQKSKSIGYRGISLPSSPNLTDDEVEHVIELFTQKIQTQELIRTNV